MQLCISCKKSGSLQLVEPGFMARCQAGRQTKLRRGSKFQKLAVDQNIQISVLFSQGTALFQQV